MVGLLAARSVGETAEAIFAVEDELLALARITTPARCRAGVFCIRETPGTTGGTRFAS